jgi:Amt family ammonium transporter
LRGKPSVLDFVRRRGRPAVVTPACGYADPTARSLSASLRNRSVFCPHELKLVRHDDALDTFGIHAGGGTLGHFTGIFTARVNPNLALLTSTPLNPATQNSLARIVGHTLWLEQLKAITVTILVAVVGSAIIGAIVRGLIGLRIAPEIERQGLDISQHGEEGYITS